MSFQKWYRRHRMVAVSLMACTGFLALAVYGWGVNFGELFVGFILLFALLLLLLVGAAGLGWVMYKIRNCRWSLNFSRLRPPLFVGPEVTPLSAPLCAPSPRRSFFCVVRVFSG